MEQKWKQKFLTIATGQAVSLIGSSAVQFALIWWLSSETGSPMLLAFAGLLAFLPQLLLGPFAGVWVDRLKRKVVVITADLFIGTTALVFAACFLGGQPPFWSACVVLGIRAVGGVFHTPAIQAIVPLLVPKEELVRANGWSQFLQSGAFMLGPVIGALLYGVLPMPVILLTDFAGALVASATVAVVKIKEIEHKESQQANFFREMRQGAAVIWRDKKLCVLLAATFLCMVFFNPLASYYPLMSSSYFMASPFHGSLVEVLYALGMMVAAVVAGLFGKVKNKFFLAYIGLFGIGISTGICGFLPATMWAFWIFAVCCMFMGGSANFYSIPMIAYMQENIPLQAQGRAFSLFQSLLSAAMPIGLLVSGPIAEKEGVQLWFLIAGIAVVLFAAVGSVVSKGIKAVPALDHEPDLE
ncbi:MAG: MFS transporter [Oscillospiraceae bacterium]|nr:MFS transporter [Oscillospiraceae bacterium]